jgi:hypothetical protein
MVVCWYMIRVMWVCDMVIGIENVDVFVNILVK